MLNAQNCLVSDQPIPPIIPGGNHCVTISGGGGDFDDANFTGGGHASLTEYGTLVTMHMSVVHLDKPSNVEQSLHNAGRGILRYWKRQILKAILVDDPTQGRFSDVWEPKDANGKPFLRDQIQPINCTGPLEVPDKKGWLGQQITWRVVFDWDLYT